MESPPPTPALNMGTAPDAREYIQSMDLDSRIFPAVFLHKLIRLALLRNIGRGNYRKTQGAESAVAA
jgi:hypothetical protein